MRIQQWSAWSWGLVLAALCGLSADAAEPAVRARAQSPQGDASPYLAGNPYEAYPAGFESDGYGPNGRFVPAGYETGAGPAGSPYTYQRGAYPPPEGAGNMNPWPAVSPFDADFSQYRQQEGLWINDQNNNGRQWYGGIELLLVSLRKPGDRVIGHPQHLTTSRQVTTGATTVTVPVGTQRLVRNLGQEFTDDFGTAGVRPILGFTDPDESGAEVSFFYVGKPSDSSQFPLQLFPAFIQRVNLANPQDLSDARTLTFDKSFSAQYQENAYGAEAMLLTTPVLGRGSNKVRALYGVRYFGLHEDLRVAAQDNTTGLTTINTSTSSQFFGPEGGVRWDLGGNKLRVFSTGKFGLLGNWERTSITAINYGDPNINPKLVERSAHVSPMLDFGVFAEAPLFRHIPLLNKTPYVRDGIFRFGWTYTALFLVSRPADIITWGDPVPVMDTDRRTWYMHGFHFNIHWNF